MTPEQKMRLENKYSTVLLDIIEHSEDFTQSDLQGAVEAQLHMLINEVLKNK